MTREQLENNYEYKVTKKALMREFPFVKDVYVKDDNDVDKWRALTYLDLIIDPFAFAHQYGLGNLNAIEPYTKSAVLCNDLGLGINAGHDLSLDNIKFFKENIPGLLEVSIGHALIADALELGLAATVEAYLRAMDRTKS